MIAYVQQDIMMMKFLKIVKIVMKHVIIVIKIVVLIVDLIEKLSHLLMNANAKAEIYLMMQFRDLKVCIGVHLVK